MDEKSKEILLAALYAIDTTLGREELAVLRDVLTILIDPESPRVKELLEKLKPY